MSSQLPARDEKPKSNALALLSPAVASAGSLPIRIAALATCVDMAESQRPAETSSPGVAAFVVCTASEVAEIRAAEGTASWIPIVAIAGPTEAIAAIDAGADFTARGDTDLAATIVSAVALHAARAQTASLADALNQVSDAVALLGTNSQVEWTNAAFTRLSGYPPDEVRGRDNFALLQSPVHPAALFETLRAHVREGTPWRGSLVGLLRNGNAVEQLTCLTPRRDALGRLEGAIAVTQFLEPALGSASSGREAASGLAALVASEQRFRTMMECAGDAILVFDYDAAHAVDVNPAACAMFGYPRAEFLKLTGADLGGPQAAENVARMSAALKASGHGHEPRHAMRRKDGSSFFADVRIQSYEFMNRRQYLVIARDVSTQVAHEQALTQSNKDLETARDRLLHSDRLASLGHLAASVAHEVNNPLQFMQAAVERLLADPQTPTAYESLGVLQDGLRRVGAITRSLLPFARVDGFRSERVRLTEVVEVVRRLTSTLVLQRARFEISLDASIFVWGDRSLLAQLLTNLVTNAAYAIGEATSDSNVLEVSAAREGPQVVLSVRDTGAGIPHELRERIFEPFFTTKPSDVGSGLGLPLCIDIAARHGGSLTFESNVGEGTTFFLTLPIAPDDAPTTRRLPEAPLPQIALVAKVLVVDDEALVAESYGMYLRKCHVDIALSGQQALEVLATGSDYDVIVCDLMMPRMDGVELYEQIAERWPGLERRVVFCSGGAFTARSREFIARVTPRMLNKPVSSTELTRTLAAVIASEAAAPRA